MQYILGNLETVLAVLGLGIFTLLVLAMGVANLAAPALVLQRRGQAVTADAVRQRRGQGLWLVPLGILSLAGTAYLATDLFTE